MYVHLDCGEEEPQEGRCGRAEGKVGSGGGDCRNCLMCCLRCIDDGPAGFGWRSLVSDCHAVARIVV